MKRAVRRAAPGESIEVTGHAADLHVHLRAWCRERLAPYKVPAMVEFRSELPKSMVGKVLRRMLTQAPHASD